MPWYFSANQQKPKKYSLFLYKILTAVILRVIINALNVKFKRGAWCEFHHIRGMLVY